VTTGEMKPLWLGGNLILARRVAADGRGYVQGCWLDWPALRKRLLDDCRDLLPAAEILPVRSGPGDSRERMLAAIPARLLPGPEPAAPTGFLSPVHLSLLAAWGGLLLAAAAVAALLGGTLSLSERRGAFVSAVTHELRSPLTTFRMYAEMLAEGMVPDEARRRQYLATLRAEADRLGHLVENVLAYARLENSRRSARSEPLAVAALLERVAERLARRAAQAGMELVVSTDNRQPATGNGCTVLADPAAVEQILFNLVDNASKYAVGAEDKRVRLEVVREGTSVALRVRDGGPGVSPDVREKLFRPFSRSAREAAGSAPGVGLGLALSRRLARQMGGDLRLEPADGGGACFVLTLPLA
jgi:signal transduction histidine kinase